MTQDGRLVLEISNVCKDFDMNGKRLRVLDNISFNAKDSEMICILGPSGCGKSTLINILAGFIFPTSGFVKMDGAGVKAPGPDRCVVFQDDALFPWLTVEENIRFGIKKKRFARNRKKNVFRGIDTEEILRITDLEKYRHHLPAEISGGMKQRVALARVLVLRPRVLLMDEPFASLDFRRRQEMQNLLVDIWKTFGQVIIFVTHDIDEAIALADRIVIMDTEPGRIKEILDIDIERPRMPDHHRYITIKKRLTYVPGPDHYISPDP